MKLLSATDFAIAQAIANGSLKVREASGRFGPFWAIEDAHGVIEVQLSPEEAEERIRSIRDALRERTKQTA